MAVFLTDFGLAKDTATGSRYTRTGVALGTPAYMSPEQARGDVAALAPASDVWALGCVLYEAAGGRAAFEGDAVAEVIGAVLTRQPRPLASRGLPAALDACWAACLDRDLATRPADARAVASACARLLQRGVAWPQRVARRRRRRAVAVVGTALVVAAGAWAAGWRRAPSAPIESVDEAERLAERAASIAREDPALAMRHLTAALARAPGRHDWRIRLGLLHWALGDGAAAQQAWRAVPAADAHRLQATLYLGMERFFDPGPDGRTLQWPSARSHLEACAGSPGRIGAVATGALALIRGDAQQARTTLANVPGWDAALVRALAEAPEQGGDPTQALRAYELALAEGLPFAWAFAMRAILRTNLGDQPGAIADATRALSLQPDRADALNARAMALHRLGRSVEARADVDAAIAAQPAFLSAWRNRGAWREQAGDREGALADWRTVLARRPGDREVWEWCARLSLDAGDLERAAADIRRALQLDPAHVASRRLAGRVAEAQGDLAAARAHYDAALVAAPGDPPAANLRALLRWRTGDRAGALADLDVAVTAAPQNLDLRFNRGSRRLEVGDLAGALVDLDEVLQHAPDRRDARHNRSLARWRLGDGAGSLADADAVLAAEPTHVPARIQRATIRQAVGDWPGAAEDLEVVVREDPAHANGIAALGVVRMQLGEYAIAARLFARALELFPPGPGADLARTMLAQCRTREAAKD